MTCVVCRSAPRRAPALTPRPPQAGDGKVRIDYTADLTLRGWKRPFVVFLNKSFNKLGRAAMEGLEKTIV